jgi:hypothetical protein
MNKRLAIFLLAYLCWTGADMIASSPYGKREATVRPPPSAARAYAAPVQEATEIAFEEMYSAVSSLGIQLSEKLTGNKDKKVSMTGFMAPPLKPTASFFILTKEPMSICPFCSSDADWPNNIVLVKLARPLTALPFDRPVRVTGILELGTAVEQETGFVSLVRIRAEQIRDL